jgi:hypothetical protein
MIAARPVPKPIHFGLKAVSAMNSTSDRSLEVT